MTDVSKASPQSQTLDRGIRVLEYLAATGTAQPVLEIGQALGLHRSVTYRLLRTLEDHHLVERDATGRFWLGLGLAGLARVVRADLQTAALPRLNALAAALNMTAFLVVRSGDEAITIVTAEPQDTAAHVVYRPGTRHAVGLGAPGLALLMPEPASPHDRHALQSARRAGWASSRGEVIPGMRSVAAPVVVAEGVARAALAVVFVDESVDIGRVGDAVSTAADQVASSLR